MEEYAIVARNLLMQYKKKDKAALNHLNLSFHSNQIIGLIGANGSGKTTFFKLCNGALEPTEGTIQILGGDAAGDVRIKEEMIYSMHALPVGKSIRVKQVLKCYDIMYPHFDLTFAMKSLDILGIPLKKTIGSLSQGMESVVHFICAMAVRAKVTLLDEPFIGIDIEKRKMAYEILLRDYMEHPRTFVISSHNLAELDIVLSEMVLIHEGNLIFYEEMDDVREMLFRADGDKEIIKDFKNGKEICYSSDGELGSFCVGRGSVNCALAKQAQEAGLQVSAVPPEDVCVYLTSEGKEDALECLWN